MASTLVSPEIILYVDERISSIESNVKTLSQLNDSREPLSIKEIRQLAIEKYLAVLDELKSIRSGIELLSKLSSNEHEEK